MVGCGRAVTRIHVASVDAFVCGCSVVVASGYIHDMPHLRVVTSLLVPLAVVLGGCASTDEPAAVDAARSFLTLVRSDPERACELLAPRTFEHLAEDGDGECSKGLDDSQPPVGGDVSGATVAGRSAQVVLGDQVVFLARFDAGWRVTAAGCERQSTDAAVPYHCTVEGD